jgi:hypothetical protein
MEGNNGINPCIISTTFYETERFAVLPTCFTLREEPLFETPQRRSAFHEADKISGLPWN